MLVSESCGKLEVLWLSWDKSIPAHWESLNCRHSQIQTPAGTLLKQLGAHAGGGEHKGLGETRSLQGGFRVGGSGVEISQSFVRQSVHLFGHLGGLMQSTDADSLCFGAAE